MNKKEYNIREIFLSLEQDATLLSADISKNWKYSLRIHINRYLEIFSFIRNNSNKKILEIGAGTGNITQFLLDKGEVTCLDASAKCIEVLRERFSNSDRISVFLNDISNLDNSWEGRIFDTVVCLNVLEHIENDAEALSTMVSLLEKNGTLILLLPAYKWLYGSLDKNLGHYRRYENVEMYRKFKKLDLLLEKEMYFNLLGILGWFLNGKILKRKILPSTQMKSYDLGVPLLKLIEKSLQARIGLSLILIARKT